MSSTDEPDPANPRTTDASEPTSPESSSATPDAGENRAWWADARMPWSGKPTRADIGCISAIIGIGLFSLGTLPFRPVLLAASPYVLAAFSGSSLAMAAIGAQTSVEPTAWWILALVLATLSVAKFDWVYWWAGKLWGQGLIDYLLQNSSKRARRNADRAQRLAKRYEVLAMALTYVPFLPLPAAIIYGALGIAGTRLRKFLALDLGFALLSRSIYLFIGYRIGEPAVEALRTFGDYAWYLSIALVVGIIALSFYRSYRKTKAGADEAS